MLSAARAGFKAASSAGLLPAFGWTLVAVAMLALSIGGYVGYEWRKGRDAIADAAALKQQVAADRKTINDLQAAAQSLRQNFVDRALAYDQASRRMDAIAQQLETHLEQERQFASEQSASLAALAARRPDLRDMRLGDDFLQHWNRSNAGPGQGATAVPAARPAGQPAPAVPAGASPGTKQRPAGAARQPRRSDRPVSAVSRSHRQPAGGVRRVAEHRLAMVVQRGGSLRPRRIGMPAC